MVLMQDAISNLLQLGAVISCHHTDEEYISKIFLIPKPNGKQRFILNLKPLNKFVKLSHFKMEDIRTAVRLINHNYYMCTIDLKESYLLLPIVYEHRKYLRFEFDGILYEFTALPYGLCTAPGVFTKLLKPVVSYLRNLGFLSTIYIDDYLCIGRTYDECLENMKATINILECLGFIINYEKSNIEPNNYCKFLGFIINSTSMCLELPVEKRDIIKNMVQKFLRISHCKIREFAKLLGTLVAACPAIPYGMVHTKYMERVRYLALLKSNDNYDAQMTIPIQIHSDLHWWNDNITHKNKPFKLRKIDLYIYTDSSLSGWGAHCNGESVGGLWSQSEQNYHINQLELMAAYFGLKCFARSKSDCNILLRIDNTTAIACINKMGSVQFPHLNAISRKIWNWCEDKNINIQASYIKSKDNKADEESRNTNIDTEWELSMEAFHEIEMKLGKPTIDLFATRINAKCKTYVSWHRDPYAYDIDSFTLDWSNSFFYAFPPFALITKCLQKIKNDQAKGILVFPLWTSQPWYPLAKILMVAKPLIFKPNSNLLLSPFSTTHPLSNQLTLAASIFCGRHTDAEVCQKAH